jgi:hypothetical protein
MNPIRLDVVRFEFAEPTVFGGSESNEGAVSGVQQFQDDRRPGTKRGRKPRDLLDGEFRERATAAVGTKVISAIQS